MPWPGLSLGGAVGVPILRPRTGKRGPPRCVQSRSAAPPCSPPRWAVSTLLRGVWVRTPLCQQLPSRPRPAAASLVLFLFCTWGPASAVGSLVAVQDLGEPGNAGGTGSCLCRMALCPSARCGACEVPFVRGVLSVARVLRPFLRLRGFVFFLVSCLATAEMGPSASWAAGGESRRLR